MSLVSGHEKNPNNGKRDANVLDVGIVVTLTRVASGKTRVVLLFTPNFPKSRSEC